MVAAAGPLLLLFAGGQWSNLHALVDAGFPPKTCSGPWTSITIFPGRWNVFQAILVVVVCIDAITA